MKYKQQNQTKNFFELDAKNWSRKSNFKENLTLNTNQERNYYVLKQIKLFKLKSIIDVGCGSGDLSYETSKITKKSFGNLYKIAAGIILGFVSIGWLITMPNKAYLSQKSYLPNKYHSSKIYYSKSERNQFLSKYDNCKAVKQKTFDENNKEVFPVICKID